MEQKWSVAQRREALKVLKTATEYVEKGWVHRGPNSYSSEHCALSALNAAQQGLPQTWSRKTWNTTGSLAECMVLNAANEPLKKDGEAGFAYIPLWNDHRSTTKAKVVKAFKTATKRVAASLKAPKKK